MKMWIRLFKFGVATWVAAIILGQATMASASQAKTSPPLVFPPLSSIEFQKNVQAVQAAMAERQFAEAEALLHLLPHPGFHIYWDDRRLSADQKAIYRNGFDRATQDWRLRDVDGDAKSELRIAFQPTLAEDASISGPANTVNFAAQDADKPTLTTYIGIKRGSPLRSATENDVYNDARLAIGTYLGVARHSIPNFVMGPASPIDSHHDLNQVELKAARQNLVLVERLRQAVQAKSGMALTQSPSATLHTGAIKGDAIQGEALDLDIKVENRAAGTLAFNAIGDCGCVVPESGPPIVGLGAGEVKARLETREFTGPMERNILLFTNDPANPTFIIPVHVHVSPRYWVVYSEGAQWVVPAGGKVFDGYLVTPEANPLVVTHARVLGMDGVSITYESWSGVLPGDEKREAPQLRHGYHFRVKVPGKIPEGRKTMSLAFITEDSVFPTIYDNVQIQKGIIALPDQLFVGELGDQPKSWTLLVSRPRLHFKISAASVNVPHFSVAVLPETLPGEYRLRLTFDGKGGQGDIDGRIVVRTDDPKQPKMIIPLSGGAH